MAGPGADSLSGGAGEDLLWGEDGNDVIRGGPDDDSMYGGPGSDRASGNEGFDTARGGGGRDLCLADSTQGCDLAPAEKWIGLVWSHITEQGERQSWITAEHGTTDIVSYGNIDSFQRYSVSVQAHESAGGVESSPKQVLWLNHLTRPEWPRREKVVDAEVFTLAPDTFFLTEGYCYYHREPGPEPEPWVVAVVELSYPFVPVRAWEIDLGTEEIRTADTSRVFCQGLD